MYFGLPAQFWLNLQNEYDLRMARTPAWSKVKPRKAAWRRPVLFHENGGYTTLIAIKQGPAFFLREATGIWVRDAG